MAFSQHPAYHSKSITAVFLFAVLFLFISRVHAVDDLQVRVVPSRQSFVPGDTVILGLQVKIPAKFHLYGNPLGPGIGKPLEIGVEGGEGINWLDVKKMNPRKFKPSVGDWVWAYENETFFFVRGITPPGWSGKTDGSIRIDGLICHNSCIPVVKKIPFTINAGKSSSADDGIFIGEPLFSIALDRASESITIQKTTQLAQLSSLTALPVINMPEKAPDEHSKAQEWDYSPVEKKINFNFWLALLFGFTAGMIMNVMPCVLPVLGIKILSFSQARESSRSLALRRSMSFSAGMLSVFMVLAALASFARFSWGEQFQNPKILVGIIALIVVFALGMFDVFTFVLPGSISNMEKKSGSGLLGDYIKGMFATILATPCSGPLLGATLAWTLTQSAQVVFTVFASIGVGMAFPYVLFASSSSLSRLVPKPGIWMKDFKYLMGFVLIGMAVYLMKGLPQDMIVSTIGLCVSLAFAVIVYTRFAPWGASIRRKVTMIIISMVIAGVALYLNFGVFYKKHSVSVVESTVSKGEWFEFSPSLLRDAHTTGRHVIVDFTASWCMNCQYNKIAVLNSPDIKELLKAKNVLLIKADLTRPDPVIESLLHHLGSRSVPFLAVFPGDNPYEPIVMRDVLKKSDLREVLKGLVDR